MTDCLHNRRDLDFQLYEVLDSVALTRFPLFQEHSRETFAAVLDTANAIASEKFLPHNRLSDEHEPQFDGQRVTVHAAVKEALHAFGQAGFPAATYPHEQGGMQLPTTIAQAALSYFVGANMATTIYAFLSIGNASLIDRYGSAAQKRNYLQPLLTGRFLGTMALTEPQAGSSLADLTTTATPIGDGRYSIRGSKIFISGGDHELSENIVHLVLARIPGSPPGVKGISLFIVPKYRIDDETFGVDNDVALAGLIHKMGCRGTTSTLLAFGERGECVGELVGEANRGLSYMFHMMNQIRIGTGACATMLGLRGYLASLDYAKQRVQGRHPTQNASEAPVAIIEHADVRRMLMTQKAYVEGAMALCLYCAWLVDRQKVGADETDRREAGQLLDLLTPILKSWPSQWCLEANSLAIQIHGGYGYSREYPVEQFYRDNRLNMIHEGSHGIQALDLLGRKVFMQHGANLKLLLREMQATLQETEDAEDADALHECGEALANALADAADTVQRLGATMLKQPDLALANATVFMDAMGHTVIAWMWLRQALAAQRGLATAHETDRAFYHGKLAACRWFYRWELPKTQAWHALLRRLDDTAMQLPVESF